MCIHGSCSYACKWVQKDYIEYLRTTCMATELGHRTIGMLLKHLGTVVHMKFEFFMINDLWLKATSSSSNLDIKLHWYIFLNLDKETILMNHKHSKRTSVKYNDITGSWVRSEAHQNRSNSHENPLIRTNHNILNPGVSHITWKLAKMSMLEERKKVANK